MAQATYPEVWRPEPGPIPAFLPEFLPYLVLLRVGFALPRALLRGRCALTAPFHPYLGRDSSRRSSPKAVYFLWHFPSNRLHAAAPKRNGQSLASQRPKPP